MEISLNLEKAFVSEKSETPTPVKAVNKMNKSCKHYGFPHDSLKCRFKDLSCNICHKKGHLQKVCREAKKDFPSTRLSQNRPRPRPNNKRTSKKAIKVIDDCEGNLDECGEDRLLMVKDKLFALKSDEFNFNINSGAAVSTLTKEWALALKLDVEPRNKRLSAYNNMKIDVLGKVVTPVQYNGYTVTQLFYVVDSQNTNLCGKDLMDKVGIYLAGLDAFSKVNKLDRPSATELLENYSAL